MKTIEHGIPNHSVIAVAQPDRGESYSKRIAEKPEYLLKDKSGGVTKCQFIDLWKLKLEELQFANGLLLLAYGQPPEIVVNALLEKYPELHVNPKIELLLLKRL